LQKGLYMGGFIYAIPGSGIITQKELESAGLASIFEDTDYSQREVNPGPGTEPCVLLCIGEAEGLFFNPQQQLWQKSLNGKFWLGFYEQNPPTALELARKNQINGHEVELNDQKWRIPLARIFPEGTSLPQTLLMGAGGELIREIIPKYAAFGAKAEFLWQDIKIILDWEKGKRKLNEEQQWLLAVEALAFNYRIGADEVNALKLFSTAGLMDIFGAIVDLPTILEVAKELVAQKKTEAAGTGDG
jgi:hypothetical protein